MKADPLKEKIIRLASKKRGRPSKLERYTRLLLEWKAKGVSSKEMQERLAKKGCQVTQVGVCAWFRCRQDREERGKILELIANGGEMNREMDRAYARDPAPEVERLIELTKTMVMELQVKGASDPSLLGMADRMQRTVVDFVKLRQREKQLEFLVKRWEFDMTKAAMAIAAEMHNPELSRLSDEEKIELLRRRLFGEPLVQEEEKEVLSDEEQRKEESGTGGTGETSGTGEAAGGG